MKEEVQRELSGAGPRVALTGVRGKKGKGIREGITKEENVAKDEKVLEVGENEAEGKIKNAKVKAKLKVKAKVGKEIQYSRPLEKWTQGQLRASVAKLQEKILLGKRLGVDEALVEKARASLAEQQHLLIVKERAVREKKAAEATQRRQTQRKERRLEKMQTGGAEGGISHGSHANGDDVGGTTNRRHERTNDGEGTAGSKEEEEENPFDDDFLEEVQEPDDFGSGLHPDSQGTKKRPTREGIIELYPRCVSDKVENRWESRTGRGEEARSKRKTKWGKEDGEKDVPQERTQRKKIVIKKTEENVPMNRRERRAHGRGELVQESVLEEQRMTLLHGYIKPQKLERKVFDDDDD